MKNKGGGMGNSRGNRAIGKPGQTIAVHPMKDHMAGNVGGSAHMSAGNVPNASKGIKFSGGKGVKSSKVPNNNKWK